MHDAEKDRARKQKAVAGQWKHLVAMRALPDDSYCKDDSLRDIYACLIIRKTARKRKAVDLASRAVEVPSCRESLS